MFFVSVMITDISQPVKPAVASVNAGEQQIRKTFDEIEAEFGVMVIKIQETLKKNNVNVSNLIIKLQGSSAVRDREVPLFDSDIFKRITSIDKLFQTLSGYWHLFDYDVLLYLVKTAECKEAKKAYDDFFTSFDSSVIHDHFNNLIHSCLEFNKGSNIPGTCRLWVKITLEECTAETKEEIKVILAQSYRLEKYALICKGIKQGCIEIIYQISPSVKSYMLQYKVTKYNMLQLKAHMITTIKIDDLDILNIDSTELGEEAGLVAGL